MADATSQPNRLREGPRSPKQAAIKAPDAHLAAMKRTRSPSGTTAPTASALNGL